MNKIYFNNDYSEIACPEIIENIAKYSKGHYIGYGGDEICESAREKIKKYLGDVDCERLSFLQIVVCHHQSVVACRHWIGGGKTLVRLLVTETANGIRLCCGIVEHAAVGGGDAEVDHHLRLVGAAVADDAVLGVGLGVLELDGGSIALGHPVDFRTIPSCRVM